MKFGKMMRRQELREGPCAGRYVDYKRIKGAIKALLAREADADRAATAAEAESPADVRHADFFALLSGEADKVDATYAEQAGGLRARLGPMLAAARAGEAEAVDVAALGALCRELDNLRAYTLLCWMAFCKALKKYDKKLVQARSADVLAALRERPFYSSDALAALLTDAEVCAALVSGEQPREEDFSCGICLGVLGNPVALSCGHRFCFSCLDRASHFGETCPQCRKVVPLDPRGYRVDTTLQDFLVEFFPGQVRAAAEECGGDGVVGEAGSDSEGEEGGEEGVCCGKPAAGDTAATTTAPDDDDDVDVDVDMADPARFDATKPRAVVPVSLLEEVLPFCEPGSFVALDLDETVVMAPSPSCMFSSRGVAVFQEEVRALAAPHDLKAELCGRFQQMLDDKVPVQKNTVEVVREMQRRGCYVFGLTARYATMAQRTQETMLRIGLDLTAGQPAHLPAGQALQDPGTSALFSCGVVYTNAVDKGVVLDRFLRHVVGLGERPEVRVPPSVVFVDDRASNCRAVLDGSPLADGLGVTVRALHYTGAEAAHPARGPELDLLAREQARHFFLTGGEILSDEDARERVGRGAVSTCTVF